MITIVVGAQFGGEGKGKVAAYLASKHRPDCTCRCGGPNSSHTVVWNGRTFRLRMMPAAAVVNPHVDVCFGAGTLLHLPTLFEEIKEIGFDTQHLFIDPQAGIVTEDIISAQRNDDRYKVIGSTLTGTGYASAIRCMRGLDLASGFPETSSYLADVSAKLTRIVNQGGSILIEGHQGFGLSNYHGDYPYTSSRDSTAASMLAEVGLGPIQRDMEVALVAKLFPTRNHAGYLDAEMALKDADALGIFEFGGGSWNIKDRRRRVGLLDFDIIRRAAIANSASYIVLTGYDYFQKAFANADDSVAEFQKIRTGIESAASAHIRYLSHGPETMDMLEFKPSSKTSEVLNSKSIVA
jgi:adenylosuccinate synthase